VSAHLLFKALTLVKWIIELGICVAELLGAHETFETFTKTRARAVSLGERGHDLRMSN
jgi:hypothetical protein